MASRPYNMFLIVFIYLFFCHLLCYVHLNANYSANAVRIFFILMLNPMATLLVMYMIVEICTGQLLSLIHI